MAPASGEPEVIVVGCGVSGLSCGIRLLERGFAVTIVARDLPPNTTSNVAAAIWYPYRANPKERVLRWGRVAFEEFGRLAAADRTGVSLVTVVELFDRPVEDPWWKDAVRGFRRLPVAELPAGYRDSHCADVPRVEMPVYMPYLVARFRRLGGRIERRSLSALSELYREDRLIVNCTGLGARDVVGDRELYPIRGQVVKVRAPDVERALLDEAGPLGLAYVLPRSDGCILGGTADVNDWRLDADPETAREILRKAAQLEPAVRGAEVLEHKVGLRPGRHEIRLELEPVSERLAVIHNYGHGGAGVTLSWGCAEEVADLALRSARPGPVAGDGRSEPAIVDG